MRSRMHFAAVSSISAAGLSALAGISNAGAAAAPDFANFAYADNPCGPATAKLSGGSGEYVSSPGQHASDLDLGAVYRGRLGGRDVAVVVLTCGFLPGSQSSADVYLIDGGRATHVKSVGEIATGEGSYAPSDWIRVRFASPFLYVDIAQDLDPAVTAHKWKVTTYRFEGRKLVAVGVLVHVRNS